MTDLILQSLPICLVVSMVVVALEEDTLARWAIRFLRYFALFYGGIILFSAAFYGLELFSDRFGF